MARRPLERERIYLDSGRHTTQLMRDALGNARAPRMNQLSLLFSLIVILACGGILADQPPHSVEGVYHFHNGYQSETLELRHGHFRYWFWTDAGAQSRDRPLEGSYSIADTTVTLHRDDILLGNQRIFRAVKGLDALWRPQALELWLTKGKIDRYGLIVRVEHPPPDLSNLCLPLPPEVCAALRNE